uniref:IF rod domain-containing protein n=1 Tax=Myotis myotis TaxID=51298 RepID=A0A7J7XZP0_MYOMY|nr:hypothetical protein mMyoMyo1_011412 [Myotis myotis]
MAWGLAGIGSIQRKKETIQYLERVSSLEFDNRGDWRTKSRHTWRRDPKSETRGHYFKIPEDLRAQVFASSVGNAYIILQIDNAYLAADDFRVKYEMELAMYHSVERNIQGSNRSLMTPISLSCSWRQIKAFKEELLFMKNNYKEEVNGLQNQIANSGLTGELDAQISRPQQDHDEHPCPPEGGGDTICHVDGTAQWDPEQLEAELAQTWAEGKYQAQEYQALLNTKVKLEDEISTYCLLLEEGKDFDFGNNVDHSNSMQSIQMTTTCMMVDGKVVSEGHPLGGQ